MISALGLFRGGLLLSVCFREEGGEQQSFVAAGTAVDDAGAEAVDGCGGVDDDIDDIRVVPVVPVVVSDRPMVVFSIYVEYRGCV